MAPTVSAAEPPALAPDRREHRDWLLAFADVPAGGLAVDLGCGRGGDLLALAARHPAPAARFVGFDVAATAVAAARGVAAAAGEGRATFAVADLDAALPLADASVDLVFSHNLLECLADRGAFVREVARVLRPGGRVVVAHWDFDAQAFDASDDAGRARVRRLVHAFADLRQPWMRHADGWMGRRLWGTFAPSGAFAGMAHARVLTNTEYAAPWYGHEMAGSMRALIKRGLAAPQEYAAFLADQAALAAAGRYWYAITGYAYVGRRR